MKLGYLKRQPGKEKRKLGKKKSQPKKEKAFWCEERVCVICGEIFFATQLNARALTCSLERALRNLRDEEKGSTCVDVITKMRPSEKRCLLITRDIGLRTDRKKGRDRANLENLQRERRKRTMIEELKLKYEHLPKF